MSAINVRNRRSKWAKFGFETSEDALTWSVFSFLNGRPEAMLEAWMILRGGGLRPESASLATSVFLWGVPLTAGFNGVAEDLVRVSQQLGEAPMSRSEPDVIIDGGEEGLIVIEVKYLSANEVNPGHPRFSAYLDSRAFSDMARVHRSGMYELVRNWRFACELAGDRPMTLINLGMKPRLLRQRVALADFEAGLRQDERRKFRMVDWHDFLHAWSQQRPDWLEQYLSSRLGRSSS